MKGFPTRHLSVSQLRDGAAYLLSVAVLPSPLPKEGSHTNVSYFRGVGEVERLVWQTLCPGRSEFDIDLRILRGPRPSVEFEHIRPAMESNDNLNSDNLLTRSSPQW